MCVVHAYAYAYMYVVWVGACYIVSIWWLEDNLVMLTLSFHLYMGSKNHKQIAMHTQQMLYLLSHLAINPPYFFEIVSSIDPANHGPG